MDRLFPSALLPFDFLPGHSPLPACPRCSFGTGCVELVPFFPLLRSVSSERMECPIALPASGSLLCEIASLTMDKNGLNSPLGL